MARAFTVPLNGEGDDGLQSRAGDHSRVRVFHLAKEPLCKADRLGVKAREKEPPAYTKGNVTARA